jgi:hypothetical protein
MLVREQTQTKKSTGVFISLTVHAVLVALLFLALTEKHLTSDLFTSHTKSLVANTIKKKQAEKNSKQEQSSPAKASEKKQPTLNQPFVVPAPVVFYGNQAMMNKPVPVSGHSEGKSAFEHTPSALPTPAAPAIAPERTPSILAPENLNALKNKQEQSSISKEIKTSKEQEKVPAFESSVTEPIEEIKELNAALENEFRQKEGNLLLAPDSMLEKQVAQEMENAPRKKQQSSQSLINDAIQDTEAKKLTLADLFKNATSTIASFAQDGLPSARKAGTEGGDDQGSGHQITIKEGDMKYYTLWAKFLNHLNQSARFNRRGKEGMIHNWILNKEIQYILQCGITIDMQGKILDIEIMVSSGCPGFDKLCISDIRSAVPYPPLPESLGKKTARFEVNVYP